MKGTFLLLILVGAVLIQDAEADWIGDAVQNVKNFLKKCSVQVEVGLPPSASVSVSCPVRGRRAADSMVPAPPAELCQSLNIPRNAKFISRRAVDESFDGADEDEDEKLNAVEFLKFLEIIEILEGCFEAKEKQLEPSQ